MKPSRLVTFAAGRPDLKVAVRTLVTGIWPGSPSRRWGIELTEGQPDTSANKANEKKSRTMKKFIAVAGLGAAITVGSLVGAGTASASEVGFIQDLNNHGLVTYDAVQTRGTPSPDVPNPIGPEPCVFVIPIATPGHWMCPEGVSPPEMTP